MNTQKLQLLIFLLVLINYPIICVFQTPLSGSLRKDLINSHKQDSLNELLQAFINNQAKPNTNFQETSRTDEEIVETSNEEKIYFDMINFLQNKINSLHKEKGAQNVKNEVKEDQNSKFCNFLLNYFNSMQSKSTSNKSFNFVQDNRGLSNNNMQSFIPKLQENSSLVASSLINSNTNDFLQKLMTEPSNSTQKVLNDPKSEIIEKKDDLIYTKIKESIESDKVESITKKLSLEEELNALKELTQKADKYNNITPSQENNSVNKIQNDQIINLIDAREGNTLPTYKSNLKKKDSRSQSSDTSISQSKSRLTSILSKMNSLLNIEI